MQRIPSSPIRSSPRLNHQRGRWYGKPQAVDRYIYIENVLPYPYAKTAMCLCGLEGACMYTQRKGVQVPLSCLKQFISYTHFFFPDPEVSHVLVYPLIWAAFENEMITHDGVIHLLRYIYPWEVDCFGWSNENTIVKKRLIVTGVGGQLIANSVCVPPPPCHATNVDKEDSNEDQNKAPTQP